MIGTENNPEKCTAHACVVRDVLDRIGDKWSILLLMELDTIDKLRFNELHKAVEGISQKMLTVTLKTLEADGLIKRTIYAQIPPKVEYNITERGKGLMPHIHNLVSWSEKNREDIHKSRMEYGRI